MPTLQHLLTTAVYSPPDSENKNLYYYYSIFTQCYLNCYVVKLFGCCRCKQFTVWL